MYDSYESQIELHYLRYTHTVEEYPNSVVHRGNRGAPTAVHEQERQRTYKRNIEARLRNHCCRGKANIVTHSECVSVALVIQYANRMRRIILSFVASLAVPYLPR